MTQKTNKNRHVSSLANARTAIPTSGHVVPGEIGSFTSANKSPNQLPNTTQAVGSASALSGRIGRRVKALGEADALAGARNPFLPRDMIPRPGLRQVAESETMEARKRRQDSKPTSSARAARNIVREDGVDDAIFSDAATPEGTDNVMLEELANFAVPLPAGRSLAAGGGAARTDFLPAGLHNGVRPHRRHRAPGPEARTAVMDVRRAKSTRAAAAIRSEKDKRRRQRTRNRLGQVREPRNGRARSPNRTRPKPHLIRTPGDASREGSLSRSNTSTTSCGSDSTACSARDTTSNQPPATSPTASPDPSIGKYRRTARPRSRPRTRLPRSGAGMGTAGLRRSGDLALRILSKRDGGIVAAGSNLVYAAAHQFGDEDRGARPLLGVRPEDEEPIRRDIVAYLSGERPRPHLQRFPFRTRSRSASTTLQPPGAHRANATSPGVIGAASATVRGSSSTPDPARSLQRTAASASPSRPTTPGQFRKVACGVEWLPMNACRARRNGFGGALPLPPGITTFSWRAAP